MIAQSSKKKLGEAPRIGIEAALSFGWERWLRPDDRFVGMTGFGASASPDVLYEHFGLTKPSIMQHGRDLAGT